MGTAIDGNSDNPEDASDVMMYSFGRIETAATPGAVKLDINGTDYYPGRSPLTANIQLNPVEFIFGVS